MCIRDSGDAPGRAVIQTFTPANETIRQAARQDYGAAGCITAAAAADDLRDE